MTTFEKRRKSSVFAFVTLCSLAAAMAAAADDTSTTTTKTTTATAAIESPGRSTSDVISAEAAKGAPATPHEPPDATPQPKKYSISADIPTCRLNDTRLSDCIKEAFEIMLPRLQAGNKELNIPPLDPFALNRTVFEYRNGRVAARLTMRKARVFGFRRISINAVDFKIAPDDRPTFRMSASVPLLQVLGDYKADVSINSVRLRPRGSFNINITKVDFDQSAEGGIYAKDGHRFVRLSKFDVQPSIGGFKLDASGIFPDKALNDVVLGAANQYWREIFRIVLPEVNRYLAPLLLRLINESLAAMPLDLVLTEDH